MTNDTVISMYKENPLIAFSIYTHGQSKYLIDMGDELIQEMNSWDSSINNFNSTYYKFWLWVLGTFEIIRTMDQHKACFSDNLHEKIHNLKILLAEIRVPFAKQELRSSNLKARKELSAVDVCNDLKFDIKNKEYSAKKTIGDFKIFINSIAVNDVIKCIHDSNL